VVTHEKFLSLPGIRILPGPFNSQGWKGWLLGHFATLHQLQTVFTVERYVKMITVNWKHGRKENVIY
jgi:hypothetical protein